VFLFCLLELKPQDKNQYIKWNSPRSPKLNVLISMNSVKGKGSAQRYIQSKSKKMLFPSTRSEGGFGSFFSPA